MYPSSILCSVLFCSLFYPVVILSPCCGSHQGYRKQAAPTGLNASCNLLLWTGRSFGAYDASWNILLWTDRRFGALCVVEPSAMNRPILRSLFCLVFFKVIDHVQAAKNDTMKAFQHRAISVNRNAGLQTAAEPRPPSSPDSSGILFLPQDKPGKKDTADSGIKLLI